MAEIASNNEESNTFTNQSNKNLYCISSDNNNTNNNEDKIDSNSLSKEKVDQNDINQNHIKSDDNFLFTFKNLTKEIYTYQEKFILLNNLIESKEVLPVHISRLVLEIIVNGDFDLERNFIIKNFSCLKYYLDFVEHLENSIQAEVWSLFTATVRKSKRNVQACIEANLSQYILRKLQTIKFVTADIFIDLLAILFVYNISVTDFKQYFAFFELTPDKKWHWHSAKLLNVLLNVPYRNGPDTFFTFSGTKESVISLPPLSRWPVQSGFTFHTWLQIDPINAVSVEKEKPYLYSACLGYTAYFVGKCLVVSYVKSSKTVVSDCYHCLQHEFEPRKWYMVSIVHVHNRWSKNELKCYVNGKIVSSSEINWLVNTNEIFDKCYIGAPPYSEAGCNFCGSLSSIYLFNEALTHSQISALFQLGPNYGGLFKYPSESAHIQLHEGQKRILYDGKLQNSVVFLYNPSACDGQLCLESSPKNSSHSFFLHTPHALLKSDVHSVITHSIFETLNSLGGIQIFFPFFSQLDNEHYVVSANSELALEKNNKICTTLILLMSNLLQCSVLILHQLVQSKALLVITSMLQNCSRRHISQDVLNSFLKMINYCINKSSPDSNHFLAQLIDHVVFNPALWIYSSVSIQTSLYTYLATDFISHPKVCSMITRINALMEILHILKYYYWVKNPIDRSGTCPKGLDGERPCKEDVISLRAYLILFMHRFLTLDANISDEEVQALFNYLGTVHEPENIQDVLQMVVSLVAENPAAMIPSIDKKLGLRIVFKLLAFENDSVRLQSLKLIGFFLTHSTNKRKQDSFEPYNLFSLLTDRLLLSHNESSAAPKNSVYPISMATYNTLIEILLERMNTQIVDYHVSINPAHENSVTSSIESSQILKVIATILHNSSLTPSILTIRKLFLEDMLDLITNSSENRRKILQMSIWEDWLFNLAILNPTSEVEEKCTELVLKLFVVLLFHAIKFEYGGWRVWIDTFSIIHSKVSWFEFSQNFKNQRDKGISEKIFLAKVMLSLHVKSPIKNIYDMVHSFDNQIFVQNTIHIISQLIDTLIMITCGLLPLISICACPSQEVEIIEKEDEESEGLSFLKASAFLQRLMHLTDALIFTSSINISELENEKNVPQGVILRQSLRLSCFCAIRSCLECKQSKLDEVVLSSNPDSDLGVFGFNPPLQAIINGGKLENFATGYKFIPERISNKDVLFQDLDINRLKAVIFRDIEETKQSQFLALSVMYFICILMVSKYRDTLTPPSYECANKVVNCNPEKQTNNAIKSTQSVVKEIEDAKDGERVELHLEPSVSYVFPSEEKEQKIKVSLQTSVSEENSEVCSAQQCFLNLPQCNELGTVVDLSYSLNEEKDKVSNQNIQTTICTINVDSKSNIQIDKNAELRQKDPVPTPDLSSSIPKYVEQSSTNALPKSNDISFRDKNNLSQSIEKILGSAASLLREILNDFGSYLSKTLLGTHGQEILNESKGISIIRDGTSTVELVMLLCSQELQRSLQNNGGLAFMELINEGKINSHLMKDHILRVSNEAEFILNRMKAEDVKKHAEFEGLCAHTLLDQREEEKLCQHLITSAWRRDHFLATNYLSKTISTLKSSQGPWNKEASTKDVEDIYWKLDNWEDDCRRRKRLTVNQFGSNHSLAALKAVIENDGDKERVKTAEHDFKKYLDQEKKRKLSRHHPPKDLIDDSELGDIFEQNENTTDSSLSTFQKNRKDSGNTANAVSFSVNCLLVAPGVSIKGTFSVTRAKEFSFDMDEDDGGNKSINSQILRYVDCLRSKWSFSEIRSIMSRRYLLQNTAIEIWLSNRTSIFFAFNDENTLKKVVNALPKVGCGNKYAIPILRKASLMSPKQLFRASNMTERWMNREISNFEYLMYLNTIAGRTFQDLNQYPVFPWVLVNYESKEIDLGDARNYRDMSKPIGTLNADRLNKYKERFENWEADSIPPFHYGTHYSTAAFTLNWLFRLEPFTTLFILFQGGKFDHANRLFSSVKIAWENCQRDSGDVKELIPEFFYFPEMFMNVNKYKLGMSEEGKPIEDVELPPWANNSPHTFIRINRAALESEFVSCQLHHWIDLIFGYKQRGPEAVNAINVFHYLTYEGNINLNDIKDSSLKEAIRIQITNFGQTPSQLLNEPHPPRQSALHVSPLMFAPIHKEVCAVLKFYSNTPIIYVCANTNLAHYPNSPSSSSSAPSTPNVIAINSNFNYSINPWNSAYRANASSPSYSLEKENTIQSPITADPKVVPNMQNTSSPSLAATKSISNFGLNIRNSFDQRLKITFKFFATNFDSKFIFACGFWNKSFIVINTDTSKIIQVIFAHFDVVTCIARSEFCSNLDCYIATGSKDTTIGLWLWSAKSERVYGSTSFAEFLAPRTTLTGHDSEVVSVSLSAELGLVVSISKNGSSLIHTLSGDFLHKLPLPVAAFTCLSHLAFSREGQILICDADSAHVASFSLNGSLIKLRKHTSSVTNLVMNYQCDYIILSNDMDCIEVWQAHDLEVVHTFEALGHGIRCLALSTCQRFIVAGLNNGSIVVLNVDFNKWRKSEARYIPF